MCPQTMRVSIMFNGHDETNDAHEATAVIGQMADGRWIVVDMSFFEDTDGQVH
jgi:hypothetical protein